LPEAALAVAGSDDAALGRALAANGLALKVSEARTIAERLGRDPTLVEAFAFDAQWSEHCSYKSSRTFLKRLPTEGESVVVGVGQDAGVVRLGEWEGRSYGIVVAHESHNHPSQVVPFEGAATGVGGIVRDVLCMGATVIAIADPLRFGPYDDPHCRYVAQGVVDGIAAYGNAIGVPNIAGDVAFHAGFRDNCLVNVVALGLVETSEILGSAAPAGSAGWDVVLVGKATDRSGFGGAAFSSLVLDEDDREQNRSAVQVPDPFLKNVVMRASYRAFEAVRAAGVRAAFKDLGAGGIMGCTAELVASGGLGATIDLDCCPANEADLPAAVLAVGETQERLAWIVPPSFTPQLLAIYNEEFSLPLVARGARAAVIGTVTEEPRYRLLRRGAVVMDVAIDLLTEGVRYERPYALPEKRAAVPTAFPSAQRLAERGLGSLGPVLARVLAHHDVCSRRPIFERFDSVVRGTTSLPCGAADAGVILPIPGAPLAVALAVDGNARFGMIDPRYAGEAAVCESIRNVTAVGARPAGLTDCLNFGNPEDPAHLGALVAAVDGLAHAGRMLGVPFVSGNVSLYNQSANGRAIPASPIVGCVGAIEDISLTSGLAFDAIGAPLFLLGARHNGLAGSVLADVLATEASKLPPIDYGDLRAELRALGAAHRRGLVRAAHDIADGGLLVALAEMTFATRERGWIGARLLPYRDWAPAIGTFDVFFGETGGFIVQAADAEAFGQLCREFDVDAQLIGHTIAGPELVVEGPRESFDLEELHAAWSAPLADFYEAPA